MEDELPQDAEYIVLPEEALKYLPEEWRQNVLAMAADGQAVLETVDDDLKKLVRLANAFPNVVSLQYIYHRLETAEFESTIEAVLEYEMLTLAFVVAYARVVGGGSGSGVARDAIPAELRSAHDQIIEWRNKRFAHNSEHDTVRQGLEIGLENGGFDINIRFNMIYRARGAPEWAALVNFLNELMYRRLAKLLEKLREKTGRDWTFPHGPQPDWAKPRK